MCTTDAECEAYPEAAECGADGRCAIACSHGERVSLDSRNVCLGGIEVSCSTLDESYCDVCDDSCPGQRCEAEVGCAPLSDVGEPCKQDSDCRTDNCSLFAGVCRVPLESECDETNCDVCISDGSGWSYCSRECNGRLGTASCPEDRCIGSTDTNYFYCRPPCNDACPGTCDFVDDIQYCDEPRGVEWSLDSPPRPALAPCRFTSHCSEGACVNAPSCDSRAFDCLGDRGFCSVECSSHADCGDEGRCVELPCPDGVTEGCGTRCLPSCDPDSFGDCPEIADADCRMVAGVDGEQQSVCDPRNGGGEYCRSDLDCASGSCASTDACVEAGGQPNGSSCGESGDCASDNCQAGTCRGNALRGDACEDDFDCSAGTCVMGTCD